MTAPVIVITGANGFVGPHVAARANDVGAEVWAVAREEGPVPELAGAITRYFRADLEHEWPVPEGASAVVHLAGLAAVGASFDQPQRYLSVNSGIMTTMCESLRTRRVRPRVVVVSTGAVYSAPQDADALTEDSPTAPGSPYAVAKILVETQAAYYARRGVDTVIARPFNHIGPGQGPGFVVPDLTDALEALPEGAVMRVGNLQAARDYTDVRDVAAAYVELALASGHRHALYNVASGISHTGYEILAEVALGLGRALPTLEVDASRLRPDDPARITGNASRLATEFGWAPKVDWRRSVADFLAARPTESSE